MSGERRVRREREEIRSLKSLSQRAEDQEKTLHRVLTFLTAVSSLLLNIDLHTHLHSSVLIHGSGSTQVIHHHKHFIALNVARCFFFNQAVVCDSSRLM